MCKHTCSVPVDVRVQMLNLVNSWNKETSFVPKKEQKKNKQKSKTKPPCIFSFSQIKKLAFSKNKRILYAHFIYSRMHVNIKYYTTHIKLHWCGMFQPLTILIKQDSYTQCAPRFCFLFKSFFEEFKCMHHTIAFEHKCTAWSLRDGQGRLNRIFQKGTLSTAIALLSW